MWNLFDLTGSSQYNSRRADDAMNTFYGVYGGVPSDPNAIIDKSTVPQSNNK